MEKRAYLEKKKKIFLRKRVSTSKEEKNIKENIFKNQVLESIDPLEKPPTIQQKKITTSFRHAKKWDIM